MRVKIVNDHLQRFTAARVQRQIKTGNLSHTANTDTVVEAGDRDLVGLVENGRGWRHGRIGDRHRQRVTFERIDRGLDAQRLEQLRRIAAQGQHVAVGGFQLAVDPHAVDTVTGVVQALNVLTEAEFDTKLDRHFRQAGSEQLAVAGLVVGQTQGASQNIGDIGQGRFDAGNAFAVEDFIRHTGLLKNGNVLGGAVQLRLGTEQLGRPQGAAFVGDPSFGTQLVEAVTAVLGQADHALLVHGIAVGGAVAQHLRHPQVLVDVSSGLDRQWCMALEQPLDGFERHARCSPWRSVARRDLAGVGKAGFHGDCRLTVDHDDFKTLPCQIVGTGGSDHTATKYQNSHVDYPRRSVPLTFVVNGVDGRSIGRYDQCFSLYKSLYLARILGKVGFYGGASTMRTQHQSKRELDKIDRNILRILQADGRISFTELGEKVGLSTTPCTERVRRLEREGIIMGYNARLNPQHLKGSLLVFVEISLDYKSGDTFEEFRRAVLKLPHVLECHLVSGDFDYLVKARISEMASYRKLLGDILLKLPHVRESKSYIVMEEVKESLNLPIPD
ncbi:Leucine-responsive regulatory protein [compost metagenome]